MEVLDQVARHEGHLPAISTTARHPAGRFTWTFAQLRANVANLASAVEEALAERACRAEAEEGPDVSSASVVVSGDGLLQAVGFLACCRVGATLVVVPVESPEETLAKVLRTQAASGAAAIVVDWSVWSSVIALPPARVEALASVCSLVFHSSTGRIQRIRSRGQEVRSRWPWRRSADLELADCVKKRHLLSPPPLSSTCKCPLRSLPEAPLLIFHQRNKPTNVSFSAVAVSEHLAHGMPAILHSLDAHALDKLRACAHHATSATPSHAPFHEDGDSGFSSIRASPTCSDGGARWGDQLAHSSYRHKLSSRSGADLPYVSSPYILSPHHPEIATSSQQHRFPLHALPRDSEDSSGARGSHCSLEDQATLETRKIGASKPVDMLPAPAVLDSLPTSDCVASCAHMDMIPVGVHVVNHSSRELPPAPFADAAEACVHRAPVCPARHLHAAEDKSDMVFPDASMASFHNTFSCSITTEMVPCPPDMCMDSLGGKPPGTSEPHTLQRAPLKGHQVQLHEACSDAHNALQLQSHTNTLPSVHAGAFASLSCWHDTAEAADAEQRAPSPQCSASFHLARLHIDTDFLDSADAQPATAGPSPATVPSALVSGPPSALTTPETPQNLWGGPLGRMDEPVPPKLFSSGLQRRHSWQGEHASDAAQESEADDANRRLPARMPAWVLGRERATSALGIAQAQATPFDRGTVDAWAATAGRPSSLAHGASRWSAFGPAGVTSRSDSVPGAAVDASRGSPWGACGPPLDCAEDEGAVTPRLRDREASDGPAERSSGSLQRPQLQLGASKMICVNPWERDGSSSVEGDGSFFGSEAGSKVAAYNAPGLEEGLALPWRSSSHSGSVESVGGMLPWRPAMYSSKVDTEAELRVPSADDCLAPWLVPQGDSDPGSCVGGRSRSHGHGRPSGASCTSYASTSDSRSLPWCRPTASIGTQTNEPVAPRSLRANTTSTEHALPLPPIGALPTGQASRGGLRSSGGQAGTWATQSRSGDCAGTCSRPSVDGSQQLRGTADGSTGAFSPRRIVCVNPWANDDSSSVESGPKDGDATAEEEFDGQSLPWREVSGGGLASTPGRRYTPWDSRMSAHSVSERMHSGGSGAPRQAFLLSALAHETPAGMLYGLLAPLLLGWHVVLEASSIMDPAGMEGVWSALCERVDALDGVFLMGSHLDMFTRKAMQALGDSDGWDGELEHLGQVNPQLQLQRIVNCTVFGPCLTPQALQAFLTAMQPFGLRRKSVSAACSTWELPMVSVPLAGIQTMETGVRCAVGDVASPLGNVYIVDSHARELIHDGNVGSIWLHLREGVGSVSRGPTAAPPQWLWDPSSQQRVGPFIATGLAGYVHERRLYVVGRVVDLLFAVEHSRHTTEIEAQLATDQAALTYNQFALVLPPAKNTFSLGPIIAETTSMQKSSWYRGARMLKPFARPTTSQDSTPRGPVSPVALPYVQSRQASETADVRLGRLVRDDGGHDAVLLVQDDSQPKQRRQNIFERWLGSCFASRKPKQRVPPRGSPVNAVMRSLSAIQQACGVRVTEVWRIPGPMPVTPMGSLDRQAPSSSMPAEVYRFYDQK